MTSERSEKMQEGRTERHLEHHMPASLSPIAIPSDYPREVIVSKCHEAPVQVLCGTDKAAPGEPAGNRHHDACWYVCEICGKPCDAKNTYGPKQDQHPQVDPR